MAKEKRFVFLSDEFYSDYPNAKYPEMERKKDRPYIQVCVEIDGVQYAIPLRSDNTYFGQIKPTTVEW